MNGARIVLEAPDLADDRVRLRPWRLDDAAALAAAWRDPTILAGARPPDDRTEKGARRWIEGWEVRRAAGLALDLAVAEVGTDVVIGEVGLAEFDVTRRAAMIGWWLHGAERGQGLASAAVALVADWALREGGLVALLARIDGDNAASAGVARNAGFAVLEAGFDGGADVWVRR